MMRKFLCFCIGVLLINSCGVVRVSTVGQTTVNEHFVAKDTMWKTLTIRQKIGQTMIMLPNRALELQLGNGSLKKYFERYPVGGFFMGWKLFDNVPESDKTKFMRNAVLEYQKASSLPLIFQEDYETGVSLPDMTPFPREMALGAANDENLAFRYGQAVALESRSVGVNWVLNPVADLNLNPFNPITNTRSISDDAEKAIRLLKQQINGLQQNGVAATIKHFPGDGVDYRDQHLLTSCNSLTMKEWKRKHGKVFRELIKYGVACIMPGHITLPAYQKEKINGMYPPATLSKELLTTLLKKEMGFKGVIVSDAMVMGGFRGWYDTTLEGELKSFEVGVDALLWPSYEFMDSLEVRIQQGKIPIERLNDAVSRIWALKERFGLLKKERELLRPISVKQLEEDKQVSQLIAESAVTLVRDRFHLLPINKSQKILIVAVTPISRKGGNVGLIQVKRLQQQLKDKGFDIDFQQNLLYETNYWSENISNRYNRIIFVLIRSIHAPYGPLEMYDDEAQSIWGINSLPKNNVIVVSMGSPYHVEEYLERVNTIINTYSSDNVMINALIRALTGEIPFKGISPVNLSMDVFDLSKRGITSVY